MAKTYETHMFKIASRKLGLDEAVLSGTRPQQKQKSTAPTAKEVRVFLTAFCKSSCDHTTPVVLIPRGFTGSHTLAAW